MKTINVEDEGSFEQNILNLDKRKDKDEEIEFDTLLDKIRKSDRMKQKSIKKKNSFELDLTEQEKM